MANSQAIGQITITDLNDFEVSISPATVFIPVAGTNTIEAGEVILTPSLVVEGDLTTNFTIVDPPTIEGIVIAKVNKTIKVSWAKNQTIASNQYIVNFNLQYNGITIPTSFSIVRQIKGDTGDPGDTGDTGATIKSTTTYYKLSATKPDKPTSETIQEWSTLPPVISSDDNSNLKLYSVVQYTMTDNSVVYSEVVEDIITDALNQALKAQSDIESLKQLTDTTWTETLSATVRETILTKGDYIYTLGNLIYQKAEEKKDDGENNWSALMQLAGGFTTWVKESDITNTLTFTSEGLRIKTDNRSDATKSLYTLLITNDGMYIQRAATLNSAYETQAQFRRDQLTVPSIRLAAPTNNGMVATMRRASDNGFMIVSEYPVTE